MEVEIVTHDDDKLPIVRQLCDVIVNSNRLYKIIQMIPSTTGNFIVYDDETNNTLEIGLSKQTYLRMFKQSHDYWYEYLQAGSVAEPNDLYLMTIGYLSTANEHHSIMNLHEKIVRQLDNYETDMEIISCLLTSKLKRINKSSLLWYWMKKLTVLLIYNDVSGDLSQNKLYQTVVSRAFKSCHIHFMNYYANNFINCIMKMNINVLGLSDDDFLFHILQKSCHENLSDSSLWFNLRNYIVCTNQIVDVSYVVDEYNRINAQYGITKLISSSRSNQVVSNADKLLVDEFKWLIQVQCKHKTPFFALISSIQTPDTLNTLINLLEGSNLEIKSDIQNYIQSESL